MAVSARALNDMRSRLRRLEERGAKRRQLALEAKPGIYCAGFIFLLGIWAMKP
jgi:hypothetical protein